MDSDKPSKQDFLLMILADEFAAVYFNPGKKGVIIPEFLKEENPSHISFNYGYNMPNPIPDLNIHEDGIFATLSFRGIRHETFLPWDSIFLIHGVHTGNGILYKESMPASIEIDENPEPQKVEKAKLSSIASAIKEDVIKASKKEEKSATKSKPFLKLVK